MLIAEKITVLPYVFARCAKCGRDLPKGRKKFCHYCQPRKAYHKNKPAACPDAEYTLEDRAAQADAYGLSYGKYMATITCGGKLPPMRHAVRWPPGSEHAGE